MAEVEAPQIDSSVKKKFLFVNRKAPYGTIYALEALEVVLISAAFEQDVSLAFLDDGVYELMKGQSTTSIGMKNFSPTYRALGDYYGRLSTALTSSSRRWSSSAPSSSSAACTRCW